MLVSNEAEIYRRLKKNRMKIVKEVTLKKVDW